MIASLDSANRKCNHSSDKLVFFQAIYKLRFNAETKLKIKNKLLLGVCLIGTISPTEKALALAASAAASPHLLKPIEVISDRSSIALSNHSVKPGLLASGALDLQAESNHAAILLAAAPENFNPGLQPPSDNSPIPTDEEQSNILFDADSLQLDFRNDTDNYGKINRFIESTARFRLANGDTLRIRTGYNYFDQPAVDAVNNVPLQIGWETQIDAVHLNIAAGVDFFDHLPTAVNLTANAVFRLSPSVTLTAVVEQGPYKFNAETLNHNITALRFGPNLYWQIGPQTSLFSLIRLGTYNDSNQELQSFSRIEHHIDNFFVAANLFTWNYENDVEQTSGYFSPSSFLVYTGEVGWEGAVLNDLRCRLAATLGQQQLEGELSLAARFTARCTVQINERLAADLGYTFSDVRRSLADDDLYHNHVVEGQLRLSF